MSLLDDGRVLLVGGWLDDGPLTADAQLFDPSSGSFTRTGSLPAPRGMHGAAVLDDGRVLIVGGKGEHGAVVEGDDAFLYDPASGEFTRTASLATQRTDPLVARLVDGRVLVVGSRCYNTGCYGLSSMGGRPSIGSPEELRARSAEIFR